MSPHRNHKSPTTDESSPPPPASPAPAGQPAANVGEPPIPAELPILPMRETVVFPGTVMPLSVGRAASLKLLEDELPKGKIIGLAVQRDAEKEQVGPEDLHHVGTAVTVLKLIKQNDESSMLLVHGLSRIHLKNFTQTAPYLRAQVEVLHDAPFRSDKKMEAGFKHLRSTAMSLVSITPNMPEQVGTIIANLDEPGHLADFLAANLELGAESKQDLLEELNVAKRIRAVQLLTTRQHEMAKIQQKIHEDVQATVTDAQRKAYLREQLRAVQKELGEEEGAAEQAKELRRKLQEAKPPEAVMKEADRELKRLENLHPASPEYPVIVSYLEAIAELPWNKKTEDHLDLPRARKILNRDHYGLEKVKRRIIEYLAVRKLNPTGRGPILCFVGPPGVGKTSLGQSIADALGRKFARMSLGGIRDEAEIRGHRRTYIGAMPGRIIQEMRRAGSSNPVMILDEIDKLGADFRGDPGSALLEVLDPRQNSAFVDRYLDVPFDLSQVMFIATANYIEELPPALRDRMEMIDLPGYTDNEKLQIARKYLAPRQIKEHGLGGSKVRFEIQAISKLIESYTREAGVRELERRIGAVCRGVAARVAEGKIRSGVKIDGKMIAELLGPEQYVREAAEKRNLPGVVTGLAYTPVGGEVLFIEAAKYSGKGELKLTGQIGEVMKESAHAALTLVRSRADQLGIDPRKFSQYDLHLHVPAGAVPKDGPSAGVAMFTSIASIFMDKSVRPDLAMTGEITLRGLVLPIGGLKEKTLAAARLGIKTVVAPKGNQKDLPEVAPEVRRKLKFVFVENIDQLLEAAIMPIHR